MRLKDKVALITGGAAGIGKATAAYFAERGWNVDASTEAVVEAINANAELQARGDQWTAITWFPLQRLGSEFMPPLYEGDFLWMPTTDPGISITKSRELLQQTNKIIRKFPEVEHTFAKIGRAETSTDPAPLSAQAPTPNSGD